MKHSAAIVIAQHGRPELTLNCIASFRKWHGETARIVIVDDGSPGVAVQRVRRANLINVKLVLQQRSGVTAAWNLGATHCGEACLVFLNNDVVTTGAWLDDLVQPLVERQAVISGVELRREQSAPPDVLRRLPVRIFAAGWCFGVQRASFLSAGGFEPSLRLYFSDTDFQARVIRQASPETREIAVLKGNRLRHVGHASTSRCPDRAAQWRADLSRFVELWGPRRARVTGREAAAAHPARESDGDG